jgi:hypothetical protein
MPLNDFANRKDSDEQMQIRYFQKSFILRPEYWRGYKNSTPLSWSSIRATVAFAKNVPDDKFGVYSFVVDSSTASHPGTKYLMYVGKAQDQSLRARFSQYLREAKDPKGRPLIVDMFTKWRDDLWFYFAEVSGPHIIHQLELDLLGAFVPPQNDVLPVEIRRAVKVAWRA